MTAPSRRIDLWMGDDPERVGIMSFHTQGDRETLSVIYAPSWLKNGFAISPDLPLNEGYVYFSRKVGDPVGFPFAVLDAEPDGWGRRVIRRLARKEKSATPRTSLDFLLGVDDTTRLGALRFSEDDVFLRPSSARSAPLLLDLKQVAGALRAVETGEETAAHLQFLSGLGTSLGGMRPKCALRDTDGSLLIGKFSSVGDERNIVRGEMLALHLASRAGLNAAHAKVCSVGKVSALAVSRFDRTPQGRVPYLSAASMLRLDRPDDFSYWQLAESARSHSPNPAADRLECWKRMVFNFLINNVDDHARNHGFLYAKNGQWSLAPAFDINPFPDKDRVLKAHLMDDELVDNIDDIVQSAPHFGVDQSTSQGSLKRIVETLLDWRRIAKSKAVGMTDKELRDFDGAFDRTVLSRAMELTQEDISPTPTARKKPKRARPSNP